MNPPLDYIKLNQQNSQYNPSLRIMHKIRSQLSRDIFAKMGYYEIKYKLERKEFLKIYAYFTSLCFLTAYKESQDKFDKQLIQIHGIDLKTLKKDGFPQLVFENEIVVEKLFDSIGKDVDIKSKCLSFDSFISIVCSFRANSIEDKIERFFKLIDEDGNGFLSYQEIYNLCTRSFKNYQDTQSDVQLNLKNNGKSIENDDFFKKLSEYFTHYIFKCVDIEMDQEISMKEMKEIVRLNKDGADLLEMFCGEDNVKLCI
eukprot:403343331